MEIVEPMSPESVNRLCKPRLDDLDSDQFSEHKLVIVEEPISEPTEQLIDPCIICKQTFETKEELERHHESHRPMMSTAKNYSSIKRKVQLGGRPCKTCQVGFQPETCFRDPYDKWLVCGVCYSLHLQDYLMKNALNKATGPFEYAKVIVSDAMKAATHSSRRYHANGRFGQCRMSQVEVDARVKAIQEDLKNGIEVDREELIHNYGLTMDDYERSLERLNKEEMKRTSTQLPLKIKIAKVENNQKKFTQGQILTAEETKKLQKVKNFDLSKVIQVKVKTQSNTPDRIGIKNESSNFVEIQPKPNQKTTPIPTQLSKSSLMSLIESQKYDQRKTNKELRKLAPDSQQDEIENKPGESPTVIRPDISKLYEAYNLISPNLTVLQDGLFSTNNGTAKRARVNSKPKRENICVNCGCRNATLWRKLKSADEVQTKRPEIKVDRSKDHLAGQLACNPCALYWSMHGRHRLKEHTIDYVPLRRKSKNHSSKISGIDTGPPTLVNMNPTGLDNLSKALATLTENILNKGDFNLENLQNSTDVLEQQKISMEPPKPKEPEISPLLTMQIDKLLKQSAPQIKTNSPSKKRKVDNDTTDSASSGSEEGSNSKLSKIDSEQPIGQALIDMFKCNLCSQIPENIEKIKTCFMCPNKIYCSECLLSIAHLLQHSKLNNFTSLQQN